MFAPASRAALTTAQALPALAIEFKSSRQVDERHIKGLKALMEDQRVREAIVVSQDAVVRKLAGGITLYPWQEFCARLWAGGFRCLER